MNHVPVHLLCRFLGHLEVIIDLRDDLTLQVIGSMNAVLVETRHCLRCGATRETRVLGRRA